ncbi:MAG: DUF4202 domain-containing protein [Actinobacteria bacterium]|nr:DUF4202 domain-containing protein [Actinomycetota bacterium]
MFHTLSCSTAGAYPRIVANGQLDRAFAAIDAANADDPTRIAVRGVEQPKELAHAALVTEWIRRLEPGASEPLLLAGRAHHLRRWTIPRSSHPEGRSGYLRWRRALHDQHARDVAAILAEVGYDDATISRVQDLVRKRGLGKDPEVQVLEDALCLVFAETQLHALAQRVEPDKMRDVMRKTLAKMSPRAIELAKELDLPPESRALLDAE